MLKNAEINDIIKRAHMYPLKAELQRFWFLASLRALSSPQNMMAPTIIQDKRNVPKREAKHAVHTKQPKPAVVEHITRLADKKQQLSNDRLV
jgi:hypothetical protein|mmetsp:Transcript_653/g.1134  ORF Transcript_653/g.1134 Transcript_653/m.1134 type:complete len:92 (+) Transcript_653:1208-1483(+)